MTSLPIKSIGQFNSNCPVYSENRRHMLLSPFPNLPSKNPFLNSLSIYVFHDIITIFGGTATRYTNPSIQSNWLSSTRTWQVSGLLLSSCLQLPTMYSMFFLLCCFGDTYQPPENCWICSNWIDENRQATSSQCLSVASSWRPRGCSQNIQHSTCISTQQPCFFFSWNTTLKESRLLPYTGKRVWTNNYS